MNRGKLVLKQPAFGQWHVAYTRSCDPALELVAQIKRIDPLTKDKVLWYNTGLFLNADFNRKHKTMSGYWFAYNGLPKSGQTSPFGRAVIWRLNGFDRQTNLGSGVLLCTVETPVKFNRTNTLRVVSRNGQHDFFLNGAQVCSATDSSFALGDVAVVMASPTDSAGHRLTVDKVRIERLEVTPGPATAAMAAEPTLPIAQPDAYGEAVLYSSAAR